MYFLLLQEQHGYESVIQATYKTIRAGDLVQDAKNMYLCLGNTLSFADLYKNIPEYTFIEATIACRNILSPTTMDCIHWMVQQYFSSYKAVVSLYLTGDPVYVFSKKPKKTALVDTKQICIIYPDLWSMTQSQGQHINWLPSDTVILHWGMTQSQKTKIHRNIQNGTIKKLLATNRGLFFDWHNLTEIIIHDPTSRAYSSQSEPRFVLQETATHIAEANNATLTYISL